MIRHLPPVLLALVCGVAVVLPEAGHSHAHRDGAIHGLPPHARPDGGPATGVVEHGHAAAVHSHLDLAATAPVRLQVPETDVTRVAALPGLLGPERHSPSTVAHGLAPPARSQHPPLPSRAPPLI